MQTSRTVRLAPFASLVCAIAAPVAAQQPQPNILFILADNVGYGDAYFADVAPGRSGWGGAGTGGSAAAMNGYPKIFNIESDPREEYNRRVQHRSDVRVGDRAGVQDG